VLSALWRSGLQTHVDDSIAAINKYLADEQRDDLGIELWYGHADMNTGARRATTYGALDAFFPAVLALSGDLKRAKRLQDSSFRMWNHAGIEPEEFDYARARSRRRAIRCVRRSSSRLTISIATRKIRNTC
jgi:hypothetical protein